VAQLAKRMPDVAFYVAGRADGQLDLPENVHLLGHLQDQKALADWYRRVSVTVLTSKRETFSMPCAESLCCGTPVVGFKAGAPEQIAMKDYSDFVEFGDLDGLEQALRNWLDRKELDRNGLADRAAQVYGADTMVKNFERVYEECNEAEKV
jgi:glycosyltransferase involved in cell wall biosynthesis